MTDTLWRRRAAMLLWIEGTWRCPVCGMPRITQRVYHRCGELPGAPMFKLHKTPAGPVLRRHEMLFVSMTW